MPQGKVLGPLLFLAYVYVNDIWRNNESNKRLFADDCIIYRKIIDSSDIDKVQTDLDRLGERAKQNKMKINPGKSKAVSYTAILKANTGRRAWKATGDRFLKPSCLSRDDHNRKIRARKHGKYLFVNRNIKSWNQLPGGLLESFPCKLNTLRNRVMNVVTSK